MLHGQIEYNILDFFRCFCGKEMEARIVCPHGHNCTTEIGDIPWQVGLTNRGSLRPWCGGTLINDRYVLTAAHCLHRKTHRFIQVVLGDHDWTDNSEATVHRSDVLQIIRHPRFGRQTTFDYDFALHTEAQSPGGLGQEFQGQTVLHDASNAMHKYISWYLCNI